MARRAPSRELACPSAASDWEGAQLLGVVGGTADAPELQYVEPRPVTPELLGLAGPVLPEEVFRFTAPCRGEGCPQFRGGRCGVAAAAVNHLSEVTEGPLPRCSIRSTCRWWHDEGAAACRRCPTVVTADTARIGTDYLRALPMSRTDGS